MAPAAPHALDGDLVAFGLMLSGMAGAALFVVFGVLCLSHGGPVMATWVMSRWAWRIVLRDPFPTVSTAYWATTADWFPHSIALKGLIAVAWLLLVAAGVGCMALDTVKGPRQERIFVDQFGQARREVSRMKEKRVMPAKMEKAVKAVTPARDRLAFELDSRRRAKNQQRAQVGLEPLKDGWARRRLTAALPTGKVKLPAPPRPERKAARSAARAEVAALGALPPAPSVTLAKAPARPRAGHDPAAPPLPPRPFGGD